MADFSIGDAVGSGFGLMGKRPVSVMAWGLTYLIVGMALPCWALAGVLGPDFIALFRNLHPGMMTAPANFAEMMGPMHAKMMLVQPLLFVTTLAAQAILTAAVFRATLEPRNRGLAYLRLGGRELWLALLHFVMRVLAVILLVVLILVGVGLGFALNAVFESQHVDWTARYCSFAALGFVMFAIFVGVCVRFSLAAPMTFADNSFRLFESWGLTRRHGWKLFGLGLLLAIIGIVMVIAFEAVVFGAVVLAAGGVHWDPKAFLALVQDQNRLWSSGVGEGMVAAALVAAYAFGAIFAVAMAPWAVAYRELLPRPKPPPAGGLFAEEPAPSLAPEAAAAAALVAAPAVEAAVTDGHADPHAHADDHGHEAHTDDHGHDDHGHADDGSAEAPADARGHDDGHGPGDDHGAPAHGAPAHDDHGHAEQSHDDGHDSDRGHAEAHGDDHGHAEDGHGDAPADTPGHDDGHGHGDDHGHGH